MHSNDVRAPSPLIPQNNSFKHTSNISQWELVWETNFELLIKFKEKHGNCAVPMSYMDDPSLGPWVRAQRKHAITNRKTILTLDRKHRLDSIGFRWTLVESWEVMCERLIQYKIKHGDCEVSTRYKEDPKLGTWVQNQRKKKDSMTKERRDRLDSLGFTWSVLVRESWDTMFARLLKYKVENGDCRVPQAYKEDPKLGPWVRAQRKHAITNHETILTLDRKNRLDSIGFRWTLVESWEVMCERLIQYKIKHGDCEVPTRYKEDPKLGRWVMTQGALRHSMTKERRDRLDSVGFTWSVLVRESWDTMFARLLKYKVEHGDCRVPQSYKDPQLGTWVQNQRKKKDSMTLERRDRLDSVGFVWSQWELIWETNFELLIKFKEKHGNCAVPMPYKDAPSLGPWVRAQRKHAITNHETILTLDRKNRLDSIGFRWTLVESWEVMCERLIQYKIKHGDCAVPTRYKEDPKLGTWVQNQRRKKDSMTKERRDRLDSLGFTWSVLVRESWDTMFARLLKYKVENGDCRVPPAYKEDPKLGTWVLTQRALRLLKYKVEHGDCRVPQSYKDPKLGTWVSTQRKNNESMPRERRIRLESVGFKWKEMKGSRANKASIPQLCGNVVRQMSKDQPWLGNSMRMQQALHPSGTITLEQIYRLNKVGFVWNADYPSCKEQRSVCSTRYC